MANPLEQAISCDDGDRVPQDHQGHARPRERRRRQFLLPERARVIGECPRVVLLFQSNRRCAKNWRYARSGVGQCARIVEYADLGVEADGAEANRRPADHVERATCGVGMVVAAIARMFDRVLSRAMGLPLKGA